MVCKFLVALESAAMQHLHPPCQPEIRHGLSSGCVHRTLSALPAKCFWLVKGLGTPISSTVGSGTESQICTALNDKFKGHHLKPRCTEDEVRPILHRTIIVVACRGQGEGRHHLRLAGVLNQTGLIVPALEASNPCRLADTCHCHTVMGTARARKIGDEI